MGIRRIYKSKTASAFHLFIYIFLFLSKRVIYFNASFLWWDWILQRPSFSSLKWFWCHIINIQILCSSNLLHMSAAQPRETTCIISKKEMVWVANFFWQDHCTFNRSMTCNISPALYQYWESGNKYPCQCWLNIVKCTAGYLQKKKRKGEWGDCKATCKQWWGALQNVVLCSPLLHRKAPQQEQERWNFQDETEKYQNLLCRIQLW